MPRTSRDQAQAAAARSRPGDLTPDKLSELATLRDRIRGRLTRAAEDIIGVGADLLRAKELLPHGAFGGWAETELGLPERQAERFMAVARRFAGKADTVSGLPPGVLYELASPSTPEAVVQRVLIGEIPATPEAIRVARGASRITSTPDAEALGRRLARAIRDAAELDSSEVAGGLWLVFGPGAREVAEWLAQALADGLDLIDRWAAEEESGTESSVEGESVGEALGYIALLAAEGITSWRDRRRARQQGDRGAE